MLAVAGSSVFFAVIHLDFRPVVLLNITLYALFASFVALEQGNLWLIAGIHAGWNYVQGNVFGLPVSGNPEASSLWSFGPASGSHSLLTGSDFGVEASLVGTAVLVVVTLFAVVRYRRTEARRTTATETAVVPWARAPAPPRSGPLTATPDEAAGQEPSSAAVPRCHGRARRGLTSPQ